MLEVIVGIVLLSSVCIGVGTPVLYAAYRIILVRGR